MGRTVDPAQDQPIAGARGGDVDKATPLVGLRLVLLGEQLVEVPESLRELGREGQPHPEALGAARVWAPDRDVTPAMAAVERPAHVGDGDDRKLEALRGMHRHDPHAVVSLRLDGRHALALVAARAPGGRLQEAAEVAPLVVLVLARKAHQLANVGHPAGAPGTGEEREVVAEGRHRPLHEVVEGAQGRLRAQRTQPLAEGAQALGICLGDQREPVLVDVVRRLVCLTEAPGDDGPDRAALADRPAQEPEGVGAHAGRWRRQGAEEHLVVKRVRDRGQDPQQVLHLLLGPVAPTTHDVRLEAGPAQRLLEGIDVGEGAKQHDDLATVRLAGVDQRAQALRQEAGLGHVVRPALAGRRLEGDVVRLPAPSIAGASLLQGQQELDIRPGRSAAAGAAATAAAGSAAN